jgi:cystathionine beta-lyase/cystathionine gamma-synthase
MTEPRESRRPGPSTVAVHGAPAAPRPVDASVVGPVHRSTTFPLDERGLADVEATGGAGTWYYGRLRNPTNARVAAVVAALEGAPAGEIFASGMAAIGTALTALVPPGGRLVAAAELYGDTRALLEGEWAAAGRRVTYVDVADLDGFARALAGGADALLVEALSNPMLRVADLPRLAALARDHGALAIVDATFASPVNVRPYEHGFDAVVHSATKYLNGHTDLVAGAVAGSEEVVARLRPLAALRGATLDPGGAYLLERGLKTLAVRMDRHNANGLAVARALRAHPDVAAVAHPFLDEHPDAALARRLLAGGSGMVTITVAGDPGRGRRLLGELRLIAHATSLGGVESIACLPVATSHAAVAEAERRRQGIEENTVRLSLGIEDADDLLADLEGALHRSARAVSA